jgi:hypothetical protein
VRIAFTYDTGTGSTVAVIAPLAIIEYEREHRTKISRLATDGVGVGDMAELVWRQLRNTGSTDLGLEEWQKLLVDIGPADAPDPT